MLGHSHQSSHTPHPPLQVRTAVFQGLKFLLAQAAVPAVVPAVKACLTDKAANIAALINDGSERVRASLLDLSLIVT